MQGRRDRTLGGVTGRGLRALAGPGEEILGSDAADTNRERATVTSTRSHTLLRETPGIAAANQECG